MTSTDLEKAGAQQGELEPVAPAGGGDAFAPHTALLEPSGDPGKEQIRTRLLLPLLLPIVSVAALFFYVINVSRVLLAGGEWGSLVFASLLTLLILGGAAWISAMPNLRTGTLTMIMAVLLLSVAGAGLTTLGASEEQGEGEAEGFVPPEGPPVATITVEALGANKFQPSALTTQAGVVEIDYVLGGGTHTFVFTDPALNGFELVVNAQNPNDSGKVELTAGKTYTFYCSVPGHRAAGMEGTLEVS